MAKDGIGASVRRKEDFRFITGQGRYTDDLDRSGQAHAYFLRSPHAHAEIRHIDGTAAAARPGVIGVYDSTDIDADDIGDIGMYVHVKDRDGKPVYEPPRRLLAKGLVRYVGEPVAVVLAEDLDAARDAAECISVDYAPLAAVTDPTEAVGAAAPQIWDDAPGNIAGIREFGDMASTEAAFAKAHLVAKLDYVNSRVIHAAIEPRAALAEYDPIANTYVMYISNQSPHVIQVMMAEDVLKVPENNVRVVSYDVGGGFGPKAILYAEEALVAWLARRCGRAVKWTADRAETFLSDCHSRDHRVHCELAVDADGRFLALKVDDVANLGAYLSNYAPAPASVPQSLLAVGAYTIPVAGGRVRMAFTNTIPVDGYRGAGRPETAYMIERLVDCAAHDLGMDKAEIRRRNLVPAEAMPYQSPLGPKYDSGDYHHILRVALEAADYDGFEDRRRAANDRGMLRGIGLSSYIEVNGIGPSDIAMGRGQRFASYEGAQVRFNTSGGVSVYTGTHNHGQGLDTTFAQLVAEGLGIPVGDVEVLHGDTATIPFGRGTVGSRSLMVGGGAIQIALDKIIAKGKKIAAHMLEAAPADIEFADGSFAVAGTDRRVGMKDVAKTAYYPADYPLAELEPGLDEVGYFDPQAAAYPFGCHVCEIEIDPDTGAPRIARYTAVDDFGVVVNPMIVEGQVHGGIAQAVGQALMELNAYDPDNGQLLTGSFMDYCMPRADDLPNFDTAEDGIPCPTNPLGVKGCGEAGTVGATPAVINAVVDALSPLGVRHLDMPATAETVWQAMTKTANAKTV